MSAPALTIDPRPLEGGDAGDVVLALGGRVDVRGLLRFHGITADHARRGARRLIVDAGGVTAIEDEALGFLHRAQLDLLGDDSALAVVAVPAALRETFALASCGGVAPLCPDRGAALVAIDRLRAEARAARPAAEAALPRALAALPWYERLLLRLFPARRQPGP